MIFKKRKLNLREIHKLYLVLKDCLPEKEEIYLLDEIDKMLDKMDKNKLLLSLSILKMDISQEEPFDLLTMFMQELMNVKFFDYAIFMKNIRVK